MTGSMNTNVNAPSISMNMGPSLGSSISGPSMGYGSVVNQGLRVNNVLDHLNDRFPTPSVGSSSMNTSFNRPSVGSSSIGSSFKGYEFKPIDSFNTTIKDTHLHTNNIIDTINPSFNRPSVGSSSIGSSFNGYDFKPADPPSMSVRDTHLNTNNILDAINPSINNPIRSSSASMNTSFNVPSVGSSSIGSSFKIYDFKPIDSFNTTIKDTHLHTNNILDITKNHFEIPEAIKTKINQNQDYKPIQTFNTTTQENQTYINNTIQRHNQNQEKTHINNIIEITKNHFEIPEPIKTKPLVDFDTTLDLANKEKSTGLMSGSLQSKYFNELKDNMYKPIGERTSDFLNINNPNKFNKPIIKGREHLDTILDNSDFDYSGPMSESIGKTNYIKTFNSKTNALSVHAPEGTITGAKYKYLNEDKDDYRLNNYAAAIKDLMDGKVNKNTGSPW